MELTPKERVRRALLHREPDALPFSWGFGINPPAKEELLRYTGLAAMAQLDQYLEEVDDCFWVEPDYVGPAERNRYDEAGVRTDVWGVRWRYASFGVGGYEEMCHNPLAGVEDPEELEEYLFPSADWWDFSTMRDRIRLRNRALPRAVKIGNGNLFECATFLRGFQNILTDLLVNPELVHALMRRVTDYFLEFFTNALDAAQGEIDIVFTADDVGGQDGLLISPGAIREFIMPYHRELNDLVHRYGAYVMYHSCGAVTEAVPDLIDCGVDILESLQFYTRGMEPGILKERFGGRLSFQGGVSVQKTLVSGTPQDICREVLWLRESLDRSGGYILAPAHHVQAGTPPENIIAILAAAGRPLPPGVICDAFPGKKEISHLE